MAQAAKAIANFFLDQAERDGRPLTPLELIKLVYIAHGWHLAVTGDPLIDERVHAWKYGPVIEDLYRQFKHFGREPITEKAWEVEPAGKLLHFDTPTLDESDPDYEQTVKVLKRVWPYYSKLSGGELIDLTHADGTPWDQIYHDPEKGQNAVIPDALIQRHFIDKAKKRKAAQDQQQG